MADVGLFGSPEGRLAVDIDDFDDLPRSSSSPGPTRTRTNATTRRC
jgi:hypothetical protein